jgi:hypothetical protein
MRKFALIIVVLSMAMVLGGQESTACEPSRKFPKLEGWTLKGTNVRGEGTRRSYDLGGTSHEEADFWGKMKKIPRYNLTIYVEKGLLVTEFQTIMYGYMPMPKTLAKAWEEEDITHYVNEELGFNYELVLRNPDSTSLASFKERIKGILACRYGSIKILSEGVDFLEYEVAGKRYYHGFFLAEGLADPEGLTTITSFEFIGFSPLANYPTFQHHYRNTFAINQTMLNKYMDGLGITPIV